MVDGRQQQEYAGIVAYGEPGHQLGDRDVEGRAVAAPGAGDEVRVPRELGILVSNEENGNAYCMP